MMLSVNLIDPIPPSQFRERINKFIDVDGFDSNHYKSLRLSQLGMILSFYDNSIIFNMYKDDEKQKELVQKFIKGIFEDNDIVYNCNAECSWLNQLENTRIKVY